MYEYRNYPCNIVSDEQLWCVAGKDCEHGGGGVLEWCTSEEDAKRMLVEMRKAVKQNGEYRFSNLRAYKYKEN